MWDDAKQMNALAATLAVLAVAGLVASFVTWLVRQPAFAFREIAVTTPLHRVSGAHLEAVIREELAGTFFTMDLERARAALATVPWVRAASLRRQWPHRLEVAVEEYEPLARLNEGLLVSTRGEVFQAQSDEELPRFDGPVQRAAEMVERYRAWGAKLRPLSLALAELSLSPRGGWRLKAVGADGPLTLEIGRDEADARLARFVAAQPQTVGALLRAGTRVEVVDLRYRNGFAVRVPGFREKTVKPSA